MNDAKQQFAAIAKANHLAEPLDRAAAKHRAAKRRKRALWTGLVIGTLVGAGLTALLIAGLRWIP